MTGYFIALEGIDGSGKSTLSHWLCDKLKRLRPGREVVATWEPGGTALGNDIRNAIHNSRFPIDPRVTTMLMVADRLQHYLQVIRPVVNNDGIVITDRYLGSTIAYQGYAEPSMSIPWIRQLHDDLALPEPDLTILLDLPPVVSLQRAGEPLLVTGSPELDYLTVVRAGYLAQAENSGWVVIDATQDVQKVREDVLQIILEQV